MGRPPEAYRAGGRGATGVPAMCRTLCRPAARRGRGLGRSDQCRRVLTPRALPNSRLPALPLSQCLVYGIMVVVASSLWTLSLAAEAPVAVCTVIRFPRQPW